MWFVPPFLILGGLISGFTLMLLILYKLSAKREHKHIIEIMHLVNERHDIL